MTTQQTKFMSTPMPKHELLNGIAVHEADNLYAEPWQSKKGYWYQTCHCKICGIEMAKPTRKP